MKRRIPLSRIVLGCPLIGALFVYSLSLRPLVVMGSSMAPALSSGQVVMLDRDYYDSHSLQRGDVVVFRWNDETYVKRVYALAGEKVILACIDGSCWPISSTQFARYGETFKKVPGFHVRTRIVPPDSFYSLGDNINASLDSREMGAIPLDAVLGRVRL